MKILFALHIRLPYPGAAWKRIGHFANTFSELGNRVFISGSFSILSLHLFGTSRIDKFRLINFTPIIEDENILSLSFNNLSSAITLFFIIALVRPDVVIISVPNGQTAFGSFLAARMLRVKKIVFDYRDEWEDFLIQRARTRRFRGVSKRYKRMMAYCYRKSYLVSAVTQQIITSLNERGIFQVKLHPNGADLQTFSLHRTKSSIYRKKLGVNHEDIILIYSGMIGVYYRLDIVVRALANIKKENVKLILIGSGLKVEDVLTLARELGVEGRVKYAGEINDSMLLAEMIACGDIGIVPYDSNTLWKNTVPAKLFEYMASGLPTIATARPDSELSRLIGHYNIGKVSEPENVEALSANITQMIEDKDAMREMSENGIRVVKMHFDRTKIAKDFYSQISRGINCNPNNNQLASPN